MTSGPAGLVAERALANDVADYIRFRAMCRACMATVRRGRPARRRRPRPPLPPPPVDHAPRTTTRSLTGVPAVSSTSIQIDLPELDGHWVFGPTAEGLLLLLDKRTSVVRLLNPLTRHRADLPPLIPLINVPWLRQFCLDYSGNIRKDMRELFDVSCAGLADDSTIVLHSLYPRTMLVAAKLGDERWTLLHDGSPFMSTIPFGGRFYCATKRGTGGGDGRPPRLVTAAKLAFPVGLKAHTLHLVDNGGELMLVHHCFGTTRRGAGGGGGGFNLFNDRLTSFYYTHRVDLDAKRTVPCRGLGGRRRAAFLGRNRTLSVSAEVFPGIRADTIYLQGMPEQEEAHLRSYDLLDGRVGRSIDWVNPAGIVDYLCRYVSCFSCG
uniref:KIB1-4 beta-propeller domain-containing protein n=1 Tax=Oryza meridionalis TaxID=40149 RepID=A0A0E0EDK0_9ORYZ